MQKRKRKKSVWCFNPQSLLSQCLLYQVSLWEVQPHLWPEVNFPLSPIICGVTVQLTWAGEEPGRIREPGYAGHNEGTGLSCPLWLKTPLLLSPRLKREARLKKLTKVQKRSGLWIPRVVLQSCSCPSLPVQNSMYQGLDKSAGPRQIKGIISRTCTSSHTPVCGVQPLSHRSTSPWTTDGGLCTQHRCC